MSGLRRSIRGKGAGVLCKDKVVLAVPSCARCMLGRRGLGVETAAPVLLALALCQSCNRYRGTGSHGCSCALCAAGRTLPAPPCAWGCGWPHRCPSTARYALACMCTRQRCVPLLPLSLRGGTGGGRSSSDEDPGDEEGPRSPFDERGRRGRHRKDSEESVGCAEHESQEVVEGGGGENTLERDIREERRKLEMEMRGGKTKKQEACGLSPQAPSLEEFKETLEKVGEESLRAQCGEMLERTRTETPNTHDGMCACVCACLLFQVYTN